MVRSGTRQSLHPPLPPDEPVNTAAPDSAYGMRRCHGAVIERGPNSIIPIRRNGRAWEADCPAAIARNEILYATRNLTRRSGRSARYHVRGRIEAVMNYLKRFGELIVPQDPDRHAAEINIRIAIMNPASAFARAEIKGYPPFLMGLSRKTQARKGTFTLKPGLRHNAY